MSAREPCCHLRDDLFAQMEALPIRYFDTHAHGDIMSVYTNDVDTLRQLLSQSIPQIINSADHHDGYPGHHAGPESGADGDLHPDGSGDADGHLPTSPSCPENTYIRQQMDLGAVDGFIEEMMDGQKVVKVFCHEQKSHGGFPQGQ